MINDYSELLAVASQHAGHTDIIEDGKRLVGFAEAALSKALRLGGMETSVTLTTDSNGDVALPADYQAMRSVRVGEKMLTQFPLSAILDGRIQGYAVQGGTLKSYHKSTGHDCVYYAKIPSLESAGTNWLLTDEPEIYLQALMFQIFVAKMDTEKAGATREYLNTLIEEANSADFSARMAGQRIYFGDVTP